MLKCFGKAYQDRIYSILMGFCWCSNLSFYLIPVLTRFGASNGHNAVPFFLIFLSFCCISVWKNQFRLSYILLYLLFVLIYYGSVFIYPISSRFIEDSEERVMIQSMPFLFFGLLFNYNKCKKSLHLCSLISIVCNVIFFALMSGISKFDGALENENMNAAYWLLPSLMIVGSHVFEEKKLIDIFLLVIGVFLLIFMGTRGPLVIYVFFIVFYFIFFQESKYSGFVKFFALTIFLLFYYFSKPIASLLMSISSSLGMSTRVLQSIIDEKMVGVDASSGRDSIISELLEYLINNSPYIGFGLGSDSIINGHFYSHNIVLEMLVSFGFCLGGLSILILLSLMYRSYKLNKSREERIFLVALYCSGFLKLCFSSRFVWDPHFYLMIGICIAIIKRNFSKTTQI